VYGRVWHAASRAARQPDIDPAGAPAVRCALAALAMVTSHGV
jgi:hypothetical protein